MRLATGHWSRDAHTFSGGITLYLLYSRLYVQRTRLLQPNLTAQIDGVQVCDEACPGAGADHHSCTPDSFVGMRGTAVQRQPEI